jgi:hypothetical protein
LFQMSGALRRKYGVPDGADVPTQVRGFANFTRDLQGEMASSLGRMPTNAETYLGHFWGGPRAARVIAGSTAGLAPADVFSPRELAENPELSKGQTAGRLASTIIGDIGRRQAKYGGDVGNPTVSQGNAIDFAQFGQPIEGGQGGKPIQVAANGPIDFSIFGRGSPADGPQSETPDFSVFGSPVDLKNNNGRPGQEIDLASLIAPVATPQPHQASGPAQIIDDYNAMADFKNRPLPPAYQELNRQNENNLVPPPPGTGSADLAAPIPV